MTQNHVPSGVEWHFWAGPSGCSGGAGDLATSAGSLLGALEEIKVVRCDEAPWRLFGLSFAGWNMVISLALFALSLIALRGSKTATH